MEAENVDPLMCSACARLLHCNCVAIRDTQSVLTTVHLKSLHQPKSSTLPLPVTGINTGKNMKFLHKKKKKKRKKKHRHNPYLHHLLLMILTCCYMDAHCSAFNCLCWAEWFRQCNNVTNHKSLHCYLSSNYLVTCRAKYTARINPA